MRISSFVNTVAMILASSVISVGCGTSEAEMTDKRQKPTVNVDIAPKPGTGGLSLKMPGDKPGKKTKTLVVTLEGSSRCYGYGEEDIGEVDGDYVAGKDAASEAELCDGGHGGDEGGGGGYCEPGSFAEYTFDFAAGETISIKDLAPDYYNVTLKLLDEQGEVIEQGSAGADVYPNELAYVAIVLQTNSGNGGLIIDVIRADEWKPEPQPEPMPVSEPEPAPAPIASKPKKS